VRLERTTRGLEGRCSIQLSYGRKRLGARALQHAGPRVHDPGAPDGLRPPAAVLRTGVRARIAALHLPPVAPFFAPLLRRREPA
jgi:hypothetical protein